MPATQDTTVKLTPPVARTAKRLAAREKRPVSEIVADALLQYEAARRPEIPETDVEWEHFIQKVKNEPMTEAELRAESQHVTKVISGQARRLGIRNRDTERIVHDSRAAR